MKKKLLFVLLAALIASALTLTLFASEPPQALVGSESLETQTPYPAPTYYYSQLTEEGKQIFDAVTSEANRALLIAGKPITVGSPFSITIPENPTQAEYDALIQSFIGEQNRLTGLFPYLSDATAAINRDRSDIFWTNGIQAATSCKIDGVPVNGSFSFESGKTYTFALEITLPLGADWDGADASDRDLAADIAQLTQAVKALATEARSAGNRRAEQLRYVNDKLCKYNDYNTPAAEGNYPLRYPWTALSALDQFTSENDASGGLKPVCEGYARALKLVCDELGIPCILVGGTGNGENHLWNYVQLENGYWYAMDVTWNDSTNSDNYFLVGKDVMDEKHTTSNQIMASNQTVQFLYPILSQSTYLPTDFSLTVEANGQTLTTPLSGGGTVTVIPNGVTDPQSLTLTCSDPSVTLTVNADGSRTATLPNTTATCVFEGILRVDGIEIPASVTVSVVHVHSHGNAVPHDATQHKQVCSCGDTMYAPHNFGEWVVTKEATEDETGLRKRVCACGLEEEETIQKVFSLTVKVNGETLTSSLSGSGTVTVIPNGVTDPQALTLTCSDPSVTLTVNADGSRTATLPNLTATYVFEGILRVDGIEIPASVTVSVVHVHTYGDAVDHNATHHKYVCACNHFELEAHAFGEWRVTKEATEAETGLRKSVCTCGFEVEDTIPKLEKPPVESEPTDKPNDPDDNGEPNTPSEDGKTDETKSPGTTEETAPLKSGNTNSNTAQKPTQDVADGCSLSIASAELILLCALGSILALRKQKRE